MPVFRIFWVALGFMALLFFTHEPLRVAGFGLLNADGAVYPITAEWLRQGHWATYQIHYPYGGNTITFLRAAWIALGGSHPFFSYYVVPALVSLSFAYMARAYLMWPATLVVAAVAMVGFHSWDRFLHIEFYSGYLIMGCLLMGLAQRRAPVWVLGIVSGLSFYTCRATLVYILPAALSLAWEFPFWSYFKSLLKPRDRIEKRIFILASVFVALYIYLELFGSNLGTVMGKAVKLHSTPNLQLSLLLMLVMAWRRDGAKVLKERVFLANCFMFGAGFLIGFLPELIPNLMVHKIPDLTGGRNYSLADTFTAIGRVPSTLRELLDGGESLIGNITILITLFALFEWYRRERKSLTIVGLSGLLATFAYVRVMTYDLAPPRYLIPLFPAILLSWGYWLESNLKAGKKWVAFSLILLHFGVQQGTRLKWIGQELIKIREQCPAVIVAVYQELGLDWVVSDDHWCGNQLTVQSSWHPFFLAHPSDWVLPEASSQASRSDRLGLIASRAMDSSTQLWGKPYRLEFLRQISGRHLYVATLLK